MATFHAKFHNYYFIVIYYKEKVYNKMNVIRDIQSKHNTTDYFLFFLFFLFIILWCLSTTHTFQENFQTDIPTYLVSLEKDIERRKNLYIHVTPHEYSSVDGSRLVSKDRLASYGILENRDIKNGAIGCYMSHYNILNKIQHYKDPFSIIIEDDVVLDIETHQENIKTIVKNAPDDWELIFIGHNYYKEINPPEHHQIQDWTLKKINYLHGAQSYIVNNQKIQAKLHELLPIKAPIDIIYPIVFNSYILDPPLTYLSENANVSNTEGIL